MWHIATFRSVLVGANGPGITANSSPFDSNTWTGQDNEVIRAAVVRHLRSILKKKQKNMSFHFVWTGIAGAIASDHWQHIF